MNWEKIKNKLGTRWIWRHYYQFSTKGRIMLRWDPQFVNLEMLSILEKIVHTSIHDANSTCKIEVNFIYGLHTITTRRPLWEKLKMIGTNMMSS